MQMDANTIKSRKQRAAYINSMKMRDNALNSTPKLYNVVAKWDGRVVKERVPMEYIASYGNAARSYRLEPVT